MSNTTEITSNKDKDPMEKKKKKSQKVEREKVLLNQGKKILDGSYHQSVDFYQEKNKFLSRSYSSKEEFIHEYTKLYCNQAKAKGLYFVIFNELKKAVTENNVDRIEKLGNIIDYISTAEDQVVLRDYYNNSENPIRSTNLIILASQHDKVKIVDFLFNDGVKILTNLSVNNTILPDDEDETHHNAFYYAIRSGNIALLDTLITKWPGNYFDIHHTALDKIVSQAYEELKLKHVPLPEQTEFYVENCLLNLRFLGNNSGKNKKLKGYYNMYNIIERIEFLLQNIGLLREEYSDTKNVDEKFLFVAKFIAQNIHILKRQLRSTYKVLPWEEMEFCLIVFISSHVKCQEINLFCHATLDKSKILDHLGNFANKLEEEKVIIKDVNDINQFLDLPKLKREKVVLDIINKYPLFEELYSDYQQIRDVYSLQKINDYMKLALLANPEQKEGQLIIIRVLQVIGEYLKNTLESPKLSSTTSDLLLLSLPVNTRKVIMDLRNSLSHSYSLSKRIQIENDADTKFFINIQNDTKRIDNVITDILHNNKIKIIRKLLKKFIDSKSSIEIKEIAVVFHQVERDEIMKTNFNEHQKLENLIKELRSNINNMTNYEAELFNEIDSIMNFVKAKPENTITDYTVAFASLKGLCNILCDTKIDHNIIREVKFLANKILANYTSKMESHHLQKLLNLTIKIVEIAKMKTFNENHDKLTKLLYEIFHIVKFGTDNLKWIMELRDKLIDKDSFIPMYKQRKAYNTTDERFKNRLVLKISELKDIFNDNDLSGDIIEQIPLYKENKKLQAAVEMLVLDVMSILGESEKYLENNLFFLDDNIPLLSGKCLRNHLAHDNTLVNILLSDPSIAVVLNAKILISENLVKNKKKVGISPRNNHSKVKDTYHQSLAIIDNQKNMFSALENGNLEDLKSLIKKGADINARSINEWTALHFASKGPSLEAIKYILDQNISVNVKDINGQSPLHIAAAAGRKNIVKFFLEEAGMCVDDLDKNKKTPLHIAAQNGHKDTIEILLKHNANSNARDNADMSPLHYAIKNNYMDIVKFLLQDNKNVELNEICSGFTSLHLAAEFGYVEIVKFLLSNGARVDVKNDHNGVPLHTAASNGHLEVVKALISKGADVNARNIGACTALHFAVENGHEKIANILMDHGADVNAVDKTYNHTPLHYAAEDGHEEIVEALLKNKANANEVTVWGVTPLHLAARNGHSRIVSLLLEYGVNIFARDNYNITPLFCAVKGGFTDVAELLIRNGAKINDKACNNVTLLHIAALQGHNDIAELLIRNKVEINTRDINNSTPLHTAAENGNEIIIDLLVKNGIETNCRNSFGITPLHLAALRGHENAVACLIKNKAQVNIETNHHCTPLHSAIMGGNKEIVNLLIKNNAKVEGDCFTYVPPLYLAVEAGHKEIVEILIANGAEVNVTSKNVAPLLTAVKHNHMEIVEVLVKNGASVNGENGEPLLLAVMAGHSDIVEFLLKSKADVNSRGPHGFTLLHMAAMRGHKHIVNNLIKSGAKVNAVNIYGTTPLYLSAQEGHEEVAEILLENNANVNVLNIESAPLHAAAVYGHDGVVEVLLSYKAKFNLKDRLNRTPLELAVSEGHLKVVRILLQYKEVDINAKGNDDYTVLHIASQQSRLAVVKFLIEKGSNIHARNASGSKPIHIAAREGFKDIVEFFLSIGMNVNEHGNANQTPLHYAAMKDQSEVAKYLIAQGADVNARDTTNLTPLHIAANLGCKKIAEILLRNGAIFNARNAFNTSPLEITRNIKIINLLTLTKNLFESTKNNKVVEVEADIRAGAIINAKNSENVAPLHYAAWKGYDRVVDVLLRNRANPNVVGKKGFTPLHYAAKFSHLKIVKALLFHGAVYNAVSDNGKLPSDFAEHKDVTNLFNLINESFKKVKEGNVQVIRDLNKIKDVDTVKAVMGACNRENKTLVVVAIHNDFSEVESLKGILQKEVFIQVDTALLLFENGKYQEALTIFRCAFEQRKEILGPNNPATLNIQSYIAGALFKQRNYPDALNMFEKIFQKQKEILGLNDKETLSTRNQIALVLHSQGKNQEAFSIYQEVYPKQKEILGSDHEDTLNTQLHMALVLNGLGKYEEALSINKELFDKRKNTLGSRHITTVLTQNNIAWTLAHQNKHEEALKIYKEVLEKKKSILGINHADTLRTLHNIAELLLIQKKYHEALQVFQEALNIQKKNLPPNHPDILSTQCNIANLFFAQGKWISALKVYKENLEQMKSVFGPSNFRVLNVLNKLKLINNNLKLLGSDTSEVLLHLQKDINIAASEGDAQTVQRLLKDGFDANDQDIDGRTSLHFAVSNGHINIVNILLKNGSDITKVTNKGNTPLHGAASKGFTEVVEILLKHISRDKLNDFINAKTISGGTTSLHVAAKGAFFEVVKALLKHGACYEVKNKDRKTPVDLSCDQKITNLLKLIDELFWDVKNGNDNAFGKLESVKPDEFLAITNARNNVGSTLLQVAIFNKQKNIAAKLLDLMKRSNKIN